MAALYAGWGFSEPFYRQEVFRAFGATTVEEFIEVFSPGIRAR
jgi:homoserine O-acetyltransferase/O-succinyltransferase